MEEGLQHAVGECAQQVPELGSQGLIKTRGVWVLISGFNYGSYIAVILG